MLYRPNADGAAFSAMTAREPIDLAHTAEFELGRLKVRPPFRQVVRDDGASEVLEPRVMKVLVALAQAPGDILTRSDLTYLCWDDRIVGEDAINRVISRLRKVGDGIGEGGFRVETVTKVGYRLALLPADAPSAEASAAGAVPNSAPPPQDANVPGSRRRLLALSALGAFAAVCAGVAAISLTGNVGDLGGAARPRLVQVQPLATRPNDPAGQSLTAALPAALSRDLVGSGTPVNIVETLPAGTARPSLIVRGNTEQEGSRLRANVELVKAADGVVIWSGEFDRPAGETDAMIEQVSLQVARELYWTFAHGHGRIFDQDSETTRLTLASADAVGRDFNEAMRYSGMVVARAPDFAQGWAEYAAGVAETGGKLPGRARLEAFARARRYALRALALDPHTGLAYSALHQTEPGIDNWFARMALVDRGLKVDPKSPELNARWAINLALIGRLQDALSHMRRSFAIDHFLPGKTYLLANIEANVGDMDDARQHLARAEIMWPDNPIFSSLAFQSALYWGDSAEAKRLLDAGRLPWRKPLIDADRAFIAWRASPNPTTSAAAARAIIKDAQQADPEHKVELIQQLAALGRIDEAYDLARQLPKDAPAGYGSWYRDYLAPFRADPRFMLLAGQQGWLAIWQRTGLWPDFCSDRSLHYDCQAAATYAVSWDAKAPIRQTAS